VLLGLQRDSESPTDYFDSVVCLLLTLEVRILQLIALLHGLLEVHSVGVRTNKGKNLFGYKGEWVRLGVRLDVGLKYLEHWKVQRLWQKSAL
jgi:hypothetical protein